MNFKQKLMTLRATVGAIQKKHLNEFHKNKYFDINDLLDALDPIFEDLGLLCTQPLINGHVVTRIEDIETEEARESSLEIPAYENPQHTGSAITYYRRYTLQALLGLRCEPGEDDDGNQAAQGVKATKKTWLTKDQFEKTKASKPAQIRKVLEMYNGKDGLAMKKAYREQLEQILEASAALPVIDPMDYA